MKDRSLKAKLALLLLVPLAGMIAFGMVGAWQKWIVVRSCARVQTASRLLRQIGNLAHELQKERGRSALYLASKGAAFSAELDLQRRATDAAIGQLKAGLARFDASTAGPDFSRALNRGLDGLADLGDQRGAIRSVQRSAAESAGYYTGLIDALLDAVSALSHRVDQTEVANDMAAYVNLIEAKEQAGIERAVLSEVFTADRFTGDTFQRFITANAAQDTYLRISDSFATAEQRQACAGLMQGPSLQAVEAIRRTAIDKAGSGGFGIAPGVWFDTATARIDAMKQAEDRLASDACTAADALRAGAVRGLEAFGFVTLAVGLAATGFGVRTMRSIERPLRLAVDELGANAEQAAAASSQISSASQGVAQGASEQAASLEETGAALEEMASVTKRNSEGAAEAAVLARESRKSADACASKLGDMREAMGAIKSSSNAIAKIVGTIDEIAFQTNILALNAAIEAARAGEAGAGFAVVAEEVRALAHRSASAAKETAEKIEEAVRRSGNGVAVAGGIAEGLADIVEKTRRLDSFVADIATASKEQSEGIAQVNGALVNLQQVTQAGSANAEETAAAAEELSTQAAALRETAASLRRLADGSRASGAAGSSVAAADAGPSGQRGRPKRLGRQGLSAASPKRFSPAAAQ